MAIKHDAITSRKDMMMVDPQQIIVMKNWNPRTEFNEEELKMLMNSIIVHGVKVPIRIKLNKDRKFVLIDGERRLRATLMAIEKGHIIESIPAIIERKGMSESDMLILAFTTNTGIPLKPFEEAEAIKRLIDGGMSLKSVCLNLGKSLTFVNNRLKLLEVTPEIKEAVQKKEISLKDATDIVNKSDGDIEKQNNKLLVKKVLKENGVKKATKKQLLELLEDIYDDLQEFKNNPQLNKYVSKIKFIIDKENI